MSAAVINSNMFHRRSGYPAFRFTNEIRTWTLFLFTAYVVRSHTAYCIHEAWFPHTYISAQCTLHMYEFFTNYIYMRYILILRLTWSWKSTPDGINEKLTKKNTQRIKHQRDGKIANAVSDKAKNVETKLGKSKRVCTWCGGKNHVCHKKKLFGVAIRLLVSFSSSHTATFFECSLSICTRHFTTYKTS